jgi:hypothetical protein
MFPLEEISSSVLVHACTLEIHARRGFEIRISEQECRIKDEKVIGLDTAENNIEPQLTIAFWRTKRRGSPSNSWNAVRFSVGTL